jgi:hypothetical protein
MPISRADMLKELLPGLQELFGMAYAKDQEITAVPLYEVDVDFEKENSNGNQSGKTP